MKFYYSKRDNRFLYLRKTKEGFIDASFPSGLDNMTEFMKGTGKTPIYEGEPMELLVPNTVDASLEKHVPVVEVDGNRIRVKVGEALHPMTDEHHIEFIILETTESRYEEWWPWIKDKNGNPEVEFTLRTDLWPDDKPLRVYAFCNLHGLWVKEL